MKLMAHAARVGGRVVVSGPDGAVDAVIRDVLPNHDVLVTLPDGREARFGWHPTVGSYMGAGWYWAATGLTHPTTLEAR